MIRRASPTYTDTYQPKRGVRMATETTVAKRLLKALIKPEAPFYGSELWDGSCGLKVYNLTENRERFERDGATIHSNTGGFEHPQIMDWIRDWFSKENLWSEFWLQPSDGGETLIVYRA